MISFESFDHMLRFAKEVDTGLLYLEEKLKNPERLFYCDRKQKAENAALCLDSLEKELSSIQEEISNMIVKESAELEMMTEERDKLSEYIKNINKEIKHYESKFVPYGYKYREDVKKVQNNLCNVENEESLECSLENMSVFKTPKKINRNSTFMIHQTNLNRSNKSAKFPLHYATPKFSEGSESSSRSNLLSQKSNKVLGNSDKSCATEMERKPLQLKNDIAMPNFNRVLFKEAEIYTPPDPGFSETSRQAYALSVGRLKQKTLTK